MPRRVLPHIGTPTSGATYLQDTLVLDRGVIAAQGLPVRRLLRG